MIVVHPRLGVKLDEVDVAHHCAVLSFYDVLVYVELKTVVPEVGVGNVGEVFGYGRFMKVVGLANLLDSFPVVDVVRSIFI